MNTRLRVGHLSPGAPDVDVSIDDKTVLKDVAFGQISGYMDVDDGTHDVVISSASGTEQVIDTTVDLDDGIDHTVLAIDELAAIRPIVLQDKTDTDLAGGRTLVRFVHASPDAPAVDVQVDDGPTLFRNVAFGEASDYIGVDASTYDLHVMPSGSDDPVLSLSDVGLDGGSAATIFATGMIDDRSLDAIFVQDRATQDEQRTPDQ